METYFDAQIRARVLQSIAEWEGTPYRHMGRWKKRGVDCTIFVGFVLQEVGIITKFDVDEYYSRDWYRHSDTEYVKDSYMKNMAYLTGEAAVEVHELPEIPDPIFGDVLLFKLAGAKVAHHCAIYLGDKSMEHAFGSRGVCRSVYGDWWQRRMVTLIRTIKKA